MHVYITAYRHEGNINGSASDKCIVFTILVYLGNLKL